MNKNQDDGALALVVIVGLICAGIVFKFSEAFSLDFETSASVLKILIFTVIMWPLVWKFTPFSFSVSWPLALAFVWRSFWPALDHWSLNSFTPLKSDSFSFEGYATEVSTQIAWYAEWYTKWGVLLLIVLGGYYLVSKRR